MSHLRLFAFLTFIFHFFTIHSELETFMLDIHNPVRMIPISTLDTFNFQDQYLTSLFQLLLKGKKHCGYRKKLKLIFRLTKDRNQALILILTIQEFQPLIQFLIHVLVRLEKLITDYGMMTFYDGLEV